MSCVAEVPNSCQAADGTAGPVGEYLHRPKPAAKPATPKQSFSCELCVVTCNSQEMYNTHIAGKKHLKKLKDASIGSSTLGSFSCQVCNVNCSSAEILQKHLDGVKHRKKVSGGAMETSEPVASDPSAFACSLCKVSCPTQETFNLHNTGSKHTKAMARVQVDELMAARDPSVYCEDCDIYLIPSFMMLHKEGNKHKRKSNQTGDEQTPPVKKQRRMMSQVDEEGNALTPLISLMTVNKCEICDKTFMGASNAILHYQSRKHCIHAERKLAETSPFFCELCHVASSDQALYDMHLKGFKHQWRESHGKLDPNGPFAEKIKQYQARRRPFFARVAAANAAIQGEEVAAATATQ